MADTKPVLVTSNPSNAKTPAPKPEQTVNCVRINGVWNVSIDFEPNVPFTERDISLLYRAIILRNRANNAENRRKVLIAKLDETQSKTVS